MRKNLFRGLSALILLAPLALAISLPAQAAVDPDSYVVMQFRDDTDPISGNSIYKYVGAKGSPCGTEYEDLWDDPACAPATNTLQVYNYLPLCADEKVLNCIDSVTWIKSDGSEVKGAFKETRGNIDPDFSFSRQEKFNVGASITPQIFTFPGLSHSKGTSYAVTGHVTQDIVNGTPSAPKIVASIAPVYSENVDVDDKEARTDCFNVNTNDVKCWKFASSDSGITFKLNMKLLVKPQGWISGRVTSPKVSIGAADASKRVDVSITGANLSVPILTKRYDYSDSTERAAWEKISSAVVTQYPWEKVSDVASGELISVYGPNTFNTFNKLVAIDRQADGKPAGVGKAYDVADRLAQVWRVVLDPTNAPSGINGCAASDFQGFVSSNAMTYGTALPKYDGATMSYDVASPHYNPGGKDYDADAFKGRYDLLLTESYAKCVWNLKDGIPTVSVEVQKTDGSLDNSVKVTGGLNSSTGLYEFSAVGFTFSSPKIKIKLSAPPTKDGTPTVTQAAPTKKAAPKVTVKTITCTKGKISKKVIGANPKCPAGFKKK
jgi:hypothetical protein